MHDDLVLRIFRSGKVTEVPLSQFQTLTLDPDSIVTVVDKETDQVPEHLVLEREGDRLEITIDGDPVAEVRNFYADDAEVTFSLDGSGVPADGMSITGEAATEQGVVWHASGAASSEVAAAGYVLPAVAAGGLALGVAAFPDGGNSRGGSSDAPENPSPLSLTSGGEASTDENAPAGTVVYTATASRESTFSLQNGLDDDAALVSIDSETGDVTLRAPADAETRDTYTFTVVASDGTTTSSHVVTVSVDDLNDNAPVFTSSATGNVDENAPTSTVIYAAAASDGDATTSNNSVTYSLHDGLADDAALVSIDSDTGEVTLLDSADAEAKDAYSFTVVASDGSNSSEQAVTVSVNDLNDNAPVFASSAAGNVDENAPTSTVIYTAAASDADATTSNNSVTYSLHGGLADDAALVSIDSDTGDVTLVSSADYETRDSYHFTVVANDGSNTTEQAVTVSVNDVDEFSGDTAIVVFDLTSGTSSDHSGRTFQSGVDYTIYIRVDSDTHDIALNSDQIWSGAGNLGAGDQIVLVGDDAGADIQGPGGAVTYWGPPDDGGGPYSASYVRVWRVTGHASPSYDAAVMLKTGNFWRKTGPSTASPSQSTANIWSGTPGSYANITVSYARTVSNTILSTQGLV